MKPRQTNYSSWLRVRLVALGVFFLVVFVALVARAVDLQLFERQRLRDIAERESIRQVDLSPRRGIIFDRNHEELAVSIDTDSIYANPLGIADPARHARLLAPVLNQPVGELTKRLGAERAFVWLARRVSPEVAENVRRLDLGEIYIIREPKRYYPYSDLACHVLGFSGLDARGLEGLERSQDPVLRGQAKSLTSVRDALGRTIHLTPEALLNPPEGNHLILTLDKQIQYATERYLTEAVTKHRAKAGQAIVMSPQTGEILAMASAPAFNPNAFDKYAKDAYRNRNITDLYEPGSTFKAFVAAAALASHRVSLSQTFDCERGQWRIGGRVIHDTHPYGMLRLAEIVKVSSNIGAAKVAQAIGAEDMYAMLRNFGFGQPTGVDLPGEARGVLRPARAWRPVEMANIAFGQGVSVTAIQMVQAFAAVANGGVMMRPHVIQAVLDKHHQVVRETRPQVVRRVMSQDEARELTRMLMSVTEDGGTGTLARVGPFAVAGKTGTAQKVNPGGGYSKTDYMSSFIGFAPAEDPKAVIMVLLDTPRGQYYGGVVAGPAFSRIARVALNEMGVFEMAAQDQPSAPKAKGPDQFAQSPPPARPASLAQARQALAQGATPDLGGMSLRQVLRLAAAAHCPVTAQGWGRVVRQSPAPGEKLSPGGLSVQLAPAHGGA